IGLANALSAQGGDLREASINGSELFTHAPKLLASPNVVIVDGAEKVRERILQCLCEKVVAGVVEQLLAPNDLVLRLEAERQCMSNGCRQTSARLTRRRFVDVFLDACTARQKSDQTLRVGRLSKVGTRRDLDHRSQLDEA